MNFESMPRLNAPHKMDPAKTKLTFVTFAQMPYLVTKARNATGKNSNTHYIQHAVCEALSRDLGIPLEDLIQMLPPSQHRLAKGRKPIEEVR